MTNFNFKKKYGQNFLKDETIIDEIISSISPTSDDLILEIGPGAGALTKRLKIYKANLIAFEIDEDTKKYLLPLEDEKTKIVYQDILTTNLNEIVKKYNYTNLYIIGNLPYYITTPIIEHIIDSNLRCQDFIIMVQKEVADRFLAKPKTKEYGYITVLLNYNFTLSRLFEVPKTAFTPQPKIDSTVIKLSARKKTNIDYCKFKLLLKTAFQFKRKTIKNNLKNYDLKTVESVLSKNGYSLTNRAEEIDLETYIELTQNV